MNKKQKFKNTNKCNIIPRFFVDLRSGCGEVRDSQHPDYNPD